MGKRIWSEDTVRQFAQVYTDAVRAEDSLEIRETAKLRAPWVVNAYQAQKKGGLLAVALLAVSLTAARAGENDEWQKVRKLSVKDVCLEAGRVLRLTNWNAATESWANVVLERARTEIGLGPQDHGHVREHRLRIGMHSCAVLAALGRPDNVSATMTARGTSHGLVYTEGRIRYVVVDDDRVVGWQE